MRQLNTLILLLTALNLSGCGGGDSSQTENSTPTSTQSTRFTLAVSDAPVDEASSVMVAFNEVELIGSDGSVVFDVRDASGNPKQVDLLSLQGSQFENIIEDVDIDVGTYSQMRLKISDDSYIEMLTGTFPLVVPSGELKLDGFTALANVQAAYTLEFDLRKSLVNPVGKQEIHLKPRGVRLVANDDVGIIQGTVDTGLIMHESCTTKVDLDVGNAVYLYAGTEDDISLLGDDADAPTNTSEIPPFSITSVHFDESTQSYQFEAAFVPQGQYTIAFSCHADLDLPESDENNEDGFELITLMPVEVVATQTTTVVLQ